MEREEVLGGRTSRESGELFQLIKSIDVLYEFSVSSVGFSSNDSS